MWHYDVTLVMTLDVFELLKGDPSKTYHGLGRWQTNGDRIELVVLALSDRPLKGNKVLFDRIVISQQPANVNKVVEDGGIGILWRGSTPTAIVAADSYQKLTIGQTLVIGRGGATMYVSPTGASVPVRPTTVTIFGNNAVAVRLVDAMRNDVSIKLLRWFTGTAEPLLTPHSRRMLAASNSSCAMTVFQNRLSSVQQQFSRVRSEVWITTMDDHGELFHFARMSLTPIIACVCDHLQGVVATVMPLKGCKICAGVDRKLLAPPGSLFRESRPSPLMQDQTYLAVLNHVRNLARNPTPSSRVTKLRECDDRIQESQDDVDYRHCQACRARKNILFSGAIQL